MANDNKTTNEEVLEEDLTVTKDIDYLTLLENNPFCFYYYDKDTNRRHIDGTLEVLEDDTSVYVITVDEIITIAKVDMADETSISAKKANNKQKLAYKLNKKIEKEIKNLNKAIKKGNVKRVR